MSQLRKRMEIVTGPTAVGKTIYALDLVKQLNGVILNADSLCVYRGMDIGTAKPNAEEQAVAPHYGIDLVEPSTVYSIGAYVQYVEGLIEKLPEEIPLVVVGGSGFYLRSFFAPVTDRIEISEAVEAQVAKIEREEGLDGLWKALCEVNKTDQLAIDAQNPRRVARALVRCLASGCTLGELQAEFAALPEPYADYQKTLHCLERSPEELEQRNRQRVRVMLEAGLIEEVQTLRDQGFEKNPSASRAIGYRETLAFLDGQLNRSELEEAIVINTRQLMRKQRTWFRHQLPAERMTVCLGDGEVV